MPPLHIRRIRRIRRIRPLAAALLLALALAACGASSHASSSAAGGSAAAASSAGAGRFSARLKLAACLRQHGVTLPAGRFGRPPGAPGARAGGGLLFGGAGRFGATGHVGETGRFGAPGRFGALLQNPKALAALRACASVVGFAPGRFNPAAIAGLRRRREAEVTAFVRCVARHGYTLPAPNFAGGPVFPRSLRTSAAFLSAAKPCEGLLLPVRALGGPGGSGGSGGPGAPGTTPGGAPA